MYVFRVNHSLNIGPFDRQVANTEVCEGLEGSFGEIDGVSVVAGWANIAIKDVRKGKKNGMAIDTYVIVTVTVLPLAGFLMNTCLPHSEERTPKLSP